MRRCLRILSTDALRNCGSMYNFCNQERVTVTVYLNFSIDSKKEAKRSENVLYFTRRSYCHFVEFFCVILDVQDFP